MHGTLRGCFAHLGPRATSRSDWEDEITAGACVTREEVQHDPFAQLVVELTILALAIFLGFR